MVALNENAVYTTAEAAKILKLSPVTVERQIRRGELKAVRFGKGYRLLGRDLLALFDWQNYARSAFEGLSREIRARYPDAKAALRVLAQVRREEQKRKQ